MGNSSILDHLFGVIYGTIYESGRGGRKTPPYGDAGNRPRLDKFDFLLVTLGDYNNELN